MPNFQTINLATVWVSPRRTPLLHSCGVKSFASGVSSHRNRARRRRRRKSSSNQLWRRCKGTFIDVVIGSFGVPEFLQKHIMKCRKHWDIRIYWDIFGVRTVFTKYHWDIYIYCVYIYLYICIFTVLIYRYNVLVYIYTHMSTCTYIFYNICIYVYIYTIYNIQLSNARTISDGQDVWFQVKVGPNPSLWIVAKSCTKKMEKKKHVERLIYIGIKHHKTP